VSLAFSKKSSPMQSSNMFSTYRKIQLSFSSIPTLKITDLALSLL
jgi:hypothetical protein